MHPQSASPAANRLRMSTCPGRRRPRRVRAAAVIVVLATALPAAACSSGGPSSAGASGSPQAGGSANSSSGLAYSRCVRAHGVPGFPDPGSGGQLSKQAVVRRAARGQRFAGRGGHGSLREAEPRRAGKPRAHGPRPAGLPEGSRLHALPRHHRLPRPDLPGRAPQSPDPRQHDTMSRQSTRPRRPAPNSSRPDSLTAAGPVADDHMGLVLDDEAGSTAGCGS